MSFFVKILKQGLEGIFIVLVSTKYFLSLLFTFFKLFSINKVHKVGFKLGKHSSLKKQGYIYNLFPIRLAVYIIKSLIGPDLGKVRLQLAQGPIIGGRAIKPNAFLSRN